MRRAQQLLLLLQDERRGVPQRLPAWQAVLQALPLEQQQQLACPLRQRVRLLA